MWWAGQIPVFNVQATESLLQLISWKSMTETYKFLKNLTCSFFRGTKIRLKNFDLLIWFWSVENSSLRQIIDKDLKKRLNETLIDYNLSIAGFIASFSRLVLGTKVPITCSWHQKTKPRIHQFINLRCCIKVREPFKTPFLMVYYFVFITLKNISSLAFSF